MRKSLALLPSLWERGEGTASDHEIEGFLTDKASAITEAEFSEDIKKVFKADGIEVHRKATPAMAVYQVSMPLDIATVPSKLVPEGAVEYDEFSYGPRRFILYYEELNGET